MTSNRNVPLGYLRAFVTLLVIAHHAVLAYHPYAPPPPTSLAADPGPIWGAFPVVDAHRAAGVDLFAGFNDTFFMSLMFLISGIFAWPSLARKGAATYFRDRARRLGVPFAIAAGILAPLAYYPTYLQSRTHDGFWSEWLRLRSWPAGPAWFLWVLLAFCAVAAGLTSIAPRWGETLGRWSGRFSRTPLRAFMALAGVSALAYLPMTAVFNPMQWVSFGPFFVQISRLLHYAVYFFAGAGLGAFGADRGLFATDGRLARRWALWVVASLISFVVAIGAFLAILASLSKGGPGLALATFGNLMFVLTCGSATFASIATFVRFARRPNGVVDSLSANAYGMYIVHYVCVTWLQYALLRADLPGIVKAAIVFTAATLLSWGIAAAVRSVPSLFYPAAAAAEGAAAR